MVKNEKDVTPPEDPPALAVAVLTRAAPTDDAECILGDLEEGFRLRARQSVKTARRWYWRQTFLSLGHLLTHRIRQTGARRLGVLALSSLLAFFAITYWDILIARNFAQFIASQSNGASLVSIRIFYYAAFVIGALLAGALAAAMTFRRKASFKVNALIAIGPVCFILAALLFVRLGQAGQAALLPYLLIRTAAAVTALLTGAYLFQKISAR